KQLISSADEFWTVWEAVVKIVPMAIERFDLEIGLSAWFGDTYSAEPDSKDVEWLPIILELGDKLVPEDAATNYKKWVLFERYLPQLREWFVAEYGVVLRLIRVRGSNSLQARQYAILIDEVPVLLDQDSVPLDRTYTTASFSELLKAGILPQQIA